MSYWSAYFNGESQSSFPCPRLNLKFKIFSELLIGDNQVEGVNHLSMAWLNLTFNIFSDILVGDMGGGQSSFIVLALL